MKLIRRLLLPSLLIALWWVASSAGIVNPVLVPKPEDVVQYTLSVDNLSRLASDALMTCGRLILGFTLGGFIGVIVGIAMGTSLKVYDMLELLVDVLRSIPIAALFPLFLMLFGIGDVPKILAAAWSTGFVVLINTMYGARACSETRQRYARTLQATRSQVLKSVVLPESMPAVFGGLRTGLGIALIVVIMSEMLLGATSGLGYRIYNAALLYMTDELYFTIVATGILGFIVNQLFLAVERKALRWRLTASK